LKDLSLNAVRYHPLRKRGHVESYFLKFADAAAERALWIKATIFASTEEPDRAIAEGWAIAFDRRGGVSRQIAVKHALPYEGASFSDRELGVCWKIEGKATPPDELSISPGSASGRISLRDHRIGWDLRFTKTAPPLVHFPFDVLYTAPFPKMKLCTPLPDARFEGEVIVDGERWAVDGWRGMQGHNWGRGHAPRYAWCHANAWEESDQFIFEGTSAELHLGPVPMPLATLICVRDRGVAYDFNTPIALLRSRGDIGLRSFEFSAENEHARIEGTVAADTADFVGLYYPNPDGSMTYCLNATLAHARVRFEVRDERARTFTSRAAALEIGTLDDGHGVRMYV
jgi:hypothetical protein